MTIAPFFQLWRREKVAHAITKASLTAAQRHFALAVEQRERARDFAVAAVEQAVQSWGSWTPCPSAGAGTPSRVGNLTSSPSSAR